MNDTKLVGNIILKVCSWCGEVINEDDAQEDKVTNITKTNPDGENNTYHSFCLVDMRNDEIEMQGQEWGEEKLSE